MTWNHRVLKTCLAARGLEVESARDGQEALVRLHHTSPDLVLLDVAMPRTSGLDVLAAIRERELDMAVVLTTGLGSEEVAVAALRLGADDYLPEPFSIGDCEAVVDRTLTRLRLKRQNTALTRRLAEQRRQLDRELAQAAEVQADLLPAACPQIPGFEIAARERDCPASAGCRPRPARAPGCVPPPMPSFAGVSPAAANTASDAGVIITSCNCLPLAIGRTAVVDCCARAASGATNRIRRSSLVFTIPPSHRADARQDIIRPAPAPPRRAP